MINTIQNNNYSPTLFNNNIFNQTTNNKDKLQECMSVFADLKIDHNTRSLQAIHAMPILPSIDRYIKPVDVCPLKISSLCEAVRTLDWKAPIFTEDKEFCYYALAAYRNEALSSAELSTVLIYFSLLQSHSPEDIRSLSVFDKNGEVNSEAVKFIKSTFEVPKDSLYYAQFSNKEDYLTDLQFEKFLDALKQAPPSEQQFFIIPDIQNKEPTNLLDVQSSVNRILEQKQTISQEIQNSVGINIFSRLDETTRMMPSFSMMQEFLNAKFEEPVQIVPTIGLSTFADIRKNGQTKTRDMALDFFKIDLPKIVDNFSAPQSYEVTYHDFYHSFIASFIPENHQQAFIILADLLNELRKNPDFNDVKPYLTAVRARFIDMEHPFYRDNGIEKTTSELYIQNKFWSSINLSFGNAISLMHLKEAKDIGHLQQLVQQTALKIVASNYIEIFAQNIIASKTQLEEKGINFASLNEISKNIKKETRNAIKLQLSPLKEILFVEYTHLYKLFKQQAYKSNLILELDKQLASSNDTLVNQ